MMQNNCLLGTGFYIGVIALVDPDTGDGHKTVNVIMPQNCTLLVVHFMLGEFHLENKKQLFTKTDGQSTDCVLASALKHLFTKPRAELKKCGLTQNMETI